MTAVHDDSSEPRLPYIRFMFVTDDVSKVLRSPLKLSAKANFDYSCHKSKRERIHHFVSFHTPKKNREKLATPNVSSLTHHSAHIHHLGRFPWQIAIEGFTVHKHLQTSRQKENVRASLPLFLVPSNKTIVPSQKCNPSVFLLTDRISVTELVFH